MVKHANERCSIDLDQVTCRVGCFRLPLVLQDDADQLEVEGHLTSVGGRQLRRDVQAVEDAHYPRVVLCKTPIANMNPGTIWSLTTSAGTETFSGVGATSTVFYGLVLDPGVTLQSITFSVLPDGVSDAFGMDNVLLELPEPTAGVLLGLCLALFGIERRRLTG